MGQTINRAQPVGLAAGRLVKQIWLVQAPSAPPDQPWAPLASAAALVDPPFLAPAL